MKAVVFGLSGTLLDIEQGQYRLQHGVDELLPILRRLGIKVVAFAPNDTKGADHLRQTGADRHFYTIMADRNDGRSPLKGLSALLQDINVQPQDAVVVGHSVADMWLGKDIQSAKVIGITSGAESTRALRTAGADHVVNDLPSLLDVLE